MGSRTGNRFAGGYVEIDRAQDGQAAAARVAVGEGAVEGGIIICSGACRTERLARRGVVSQVNPVCTGAVRPKANQIPVVFLSRPVNSHGAVGAADAGRTCCAARAAVMTTVSILPASIIRIVAGTTSEANSLDVRILRVGQLNIGTVGSR